MAEKLDNLDLSSIGEDAIDRDIVEEAIGGKRPIVKEHERVTLIERKLYLINNIMNSGTVQGEGITRKVDYIISDEINRGILEQKMMNLLNEL